MIKCFLKEIKKKKNIDKLSHGYNKIIKVTLSF